MTPREYALLGLIVALCGALCYLGYRLHVLERDTYRLAPEPRVPVSLTLELLNTQHRHALELAHAISTGAPPEDPTDALRRVMKGNYPITPVGLPPLIEPVDDGSDYTDLTLPDPRVFSTPGQHVPQPEDDEIFKYPPVGSV